MMMMMMKDDDSRSLKADAERMAEELKKEQEQRKLLEDGLKADLRTLTNANAAGYVQKSFYRVLTKEMMMSIASHDSKIQLKRLFFPSQLILEI